MGSKLGGKGKEEKTRKKTQPCGTSSYNTYLHCRTHCPKWKVHAGWKGKKTANKKKKRARERENSWKQSPLKWLNTEIPLPVKNTSAINLWICKQSIWETLLCACPIPKAFSAVSLSGLRFGARWTCDLRWYSPLMVLLSCAHQLKVNYLRLCASKHSFCRESDAGAAYCSASLLKRLLFK